MLSLNPQLELHLREHGDLSSECSGENNETPSSSTSEPKQKGGGTAVSCTRGNSVARNGAINNVWGVGLGMIVGYTSSIVHNVEYSSFLNEKFIQKFTITICAATSVLLLWILYGIARGMSHKTTADCSQGHVCRMQISDLLGSIGAPPLEPDPCVSSSHTTASFKPSSLGNTPVEVLNKTEVGMLVSFARAHANLLLALDRSMETIRIGTGLRLGLGPSSRCVERVDMSTIGREYRMKQKGELIHGLEEITQKGRLRRSVSFHNARRILCRVVVNQFTSLESVLVALDGDACGNRCLVEPDILTLFWLRKSRREVGELLSQTLSHLTTTCAILESRLPREQLESVLQESTWKALEACQYVASVFGFDSIKSDDETQAINNSALSGSASFRQHVGRMYSQLDAAYVALWACEDVMIQSGVSAIRRQNEEDNDIPDDKDGRGSIEEWLSHVEQLLSIALDVHRHFKCSLLDTGSMPGSEDNVVEDTTASTAVSGEVPFHYEHFGESTCAVAKPLEWSELKDKTAVFAGTGGLPQRSLRSESSCPYTEAEAAAKRRNQASLLEELVNRLGLMELVEEVDMTGSSAEEETDEKEGMTSTRLKQNHSSVSPMFLGASDSLLLELKRHMAETRP